MDNPLQALGGDGGIRTHGPAHHRSNDFESLEAGVFWSILSASLRLSERRKPLILLGFPAFLLSTQGFGIFPVKADFPEKCEHSVSVL